MDRQPQEVIAEKRQYLANLLEYHCGLSALTMTGGIPAREKKTGGRGQRKENRNKGTHSMERRSGI